jgi:simple sugar transport system permease protein
MVPPVNVGFQSHGWPQLRRCPLFRHQRAAHDGADDVHLWGLAGLAGAIQTQGVFHEFQTNQSLTLGFDSIAVALLASNNPIGIIPSALLFGILGAGGSNMQLTSRVPVELIQVIQALVLMFVAANQIIRHLYRIRAAEVGEKVILSTGWGRR